LTLKSLSENRCCRTWKVRFPAPNSRFASARSTPTVAGDKVYLESGNGMIYCLNALSGEQVWAAEW
jgi:outer membrane protein assembly factor BamB